MACPACGGETITYPVAPALREQLPGDAAGARTCRDCLALRPEPDPPDAVPDLTVVADAVPSDPDTAVPLLLLVGLLESLAVNRQEITALLEAVERGGADPLLAVDRLDHAVDDPHVDLGARRRQLEQLL